MSPCDKSQNSLLDRGLGVGGKRIRVSQVVCPCRLRLCGARDTSRDHVRSATECAPAIAFMLVALSACHTVCSSTAVPLSGCVSANLPSSQIRMQLQKLECLTSKVKVELKSITQTLFSPYFCFSKYA